MGRRQLQEVVRPQLTGRARVADARNHGPAASPRLSPLVQLQQTIGNRAVGRLAQAKLKVAAPRDRFDREADRVADQVTRAPAPDVTTAHAQAPRGRRPDGSERTEASGEAPATVDEVLRAPGEPLDAATRAWFEPRFGRGFPEVRVHSGPSAGQSARDVDAEAYTVGHHVVFAPGRFAPETDDGRRLIAHELTHVLQQSPGPGRKVAPGGILQRKLLVRGKPKPKHIQAFFDLLESPAGVTLRYDPGSEEVSISASRASPPSSALRLRLEEIIDDPRLHAELRLGGPEPGLSFGKFPETGPLIQQIDIENLTRLEAGAPGSGVAILFHEIVENHHAHAFGPDFEMAHEAALEAERQAAGQLVRSGGRVARAIADKGKGVIRWVHDYENYFVVYDRALSSDTVINSRQSARVNVGTFTIVGFAPGSDVVPGAAQAVIAAVANAMRMHPAATVRIEAGGQDMRLARLRAARVENAILDYGKDRQLQGFDLRAGFNFSSVATGHSDERLVIVVDQPDTEVEASRGSLVKAWLTDKARRQAQASAGAPALRRRR